MFIFIYHFNVAPTGFPSNPPYLAPGKPPRCCKAPAVCMARGWNVDIKSTASFPGGKKNPNFWPKRIIYRLILLFRAVECFYSCVTGDVWIPLPGEFSLCWNLEAFWTKGRATPDHESTQTRQIQIFSSNNKERQTDCNNNTAIVKQCEIYIQNNNLPVRFHSG